MDEQGNSGMPIFNSKLIGEKRQSAESGEKLEVAKKRIKIRNLESVLSQENAQHSRNKEVHDQFRFSQEVSLVTDVPLTLDLDASQAQRSGRTSLSVNVTPPRTLDLNSEACSSTISANNCIQECAEDLDKNSRLKNHDREHDNKFVTSDSIGLDLNEEYIASFANQDSCGHRKAHNFLKLRDVSECASTSGPVEEKDPMRVWKEMKQNGFLSSSHGGILIQSGISSSHGGIPMPKKRARKTKNDVIKKKMELAKREQVDRFTKIAAPSGLLNGLNPGIINHVRNKKQVHSIIEALVRSEKHEIDRVENKQLIHLKSGSKENGNASDSGIHRPNLSQGDGNLAAFSESKQTGGLITSREGESSMVDRICARNIVSHSSAISEEDTLALKLSSLTKASDESSTFSNGESANVTNGSSLCIKAASVASQWLDLLHQDIKGRLTALRRSKKRVRSVITTELPFLISKEFSSNQENDPYVLKHSPDEFSSTVAMHKARWSTLFDQMDKSLSEEEKQLESWLNQVKQMQLHCDQGIQHFYTVFGFQQQGLSEIYTRAGKADSSEKELAVRAAAASIYSTCNFLMSKETVSCV